MEARRAELIALLEQTCDQNDLRVLVRGLFNGQSLANQLPETDPRGAPSGAQRVYRGSSWNSPADGARSTDRVRYDPTGHWNSLGLRLALSAPP